MAQDVNDTDHKLETSISDYSSSDEMIVSLNLNAYHSVRRAGIWTEFAQKRTSRALARAHREIAEAKSTNQNLAK